MTFTALDDLKNWYNVLLDGMECDERDCQACVALVRKGKRGFAEACKVLAHLINDIWCDERSCEACVALVRKGKRGYAEACKVLAHLIINKDFDPDMARINSPQWWKIASEEAMDAIEHPDS